jgi:hydroxyacylglutathione hydrolase
MTVIVIHQFPCLSDNYGFLVHAPATGETACVDTPDAETCLREAESRGWRITHILNTHWHPDHTGGNTLIRDACAARVIAPEEIARTGAAIDLVVRGGDRFAFAGVDVDVIDVGGHTLGHVAYHFAGIRAAFVGDSLFALGCGRLFEGTAAQMWASLGRLAALPDNTLIYCAHEYTAANARFALSVDPDNERLKRRWAQIQDLRGRGLPTVPSSLAEERATNPFLRAPLLRPELADPAMAFAELRAAKDAFR